MNFTKHTTVLQVLVHLRRGNKLRLTLQEFLDNPTVGQAIIDLIQANVVTSRVSKDGKMTIHEFRWTDET